MQMCYKIVFEAFSAKAPSTKERKKKNNDKRDTKKKEDKKKRKKKKKRREKNERKLVHKISLLFNLLSSR